MTRSKKPGGFTGLPIRKSRPDGPPGWAMTAAYDLIAKLEGYGDLTLTRDAERIAYALEHQWRDGYAGGRKTGEKGIVDFMAALVEGRHK